MKTVIRETPEKLPHARIFIDDLIEIEAFARKAYQDSIGAETVDFEYEVDGKLRMTTHEELVEHGGNARKFTVTATWSQFGGTMRETFLHLRGRITPTLTLWEIREDAAWALHGRVKAVFEARKLRMRSLLDLLPASVQGFLTGSMGTFGAGLFILAGKGHNLSSGIEYVCAAVLSAAVLFLLLLGQQGSEINLRYARKEYQERAAERKDLVQKVGLLLLAAIFGSICTVVVSFLMKK